MQLSIFEARKIWWVISDYILGGFVNDSSTRLWGGWLRYFTYGILRKHDI
jgi:hypothetical protein